MGAGWKATGKAEVAQKKGQLYTKLAREIAVAAKLGGPDPASNSRLKLAIDAAKEVSCPKDTIERAIKRGSGQLDDGAEIEELTYEGLGPSGVGYMVECQTDNRNRTVSELRNIFRRHEGTLGETGSVAWMFERVSVVVGRKANVQDPEEDAIECGANDVEKTNDGDYLFWGNPSDLDQLRTELQKRNWSIAAAELSYKSKTATSVTDPEILQNLKELEQELNDLDDTHRVHSSLSED